MLHPRKRTQFAGIITLSRLHLDCHYFPLCSIQSVFIVWPVSSLPSPACLFTGTLSLLFPIPSIFFLLALFWSTPCNNLTQSKFCKYRYLLFRNVQFLWEKDRTQKRAVSVGKRVWIVMFDENRTSRLDFEGVTIPFP